jgi:hypothetical protein
VNDNATLPGAISACCTSSLRVVGEGPDWVELACVGCDKRFKVEKPLKSTYRGARIDTDPDCPAAMEVRVSNGEEECNCDQSLALQRESDRLRQAIEFVLPGLENGLRAKQIGLQPVEEYVRVLREALGGTLRQAVDNASAVPAALEEAQALVADLAEWLYTAHSRTVPELQARLARLRGWPATRSCVD